jgi:hypothetical protein
MEACTSRFDPRSSLQPACPQCEKPMRLIAIEPLNDGFDLRTFECHACSHREQATLKFFE